MFVWISKKKRKALRVLFDMAEQSLDRGSYCYSDWPKAWEAALSLEKLAYPEGSDFVSDVIANAEQDGIRKRDILLSK